MAFFFELTNKKNAEFISLHFELSKINYGVKYFYHDKNETMDQLYSFFIFKYFEAIMKAIMFKSESERKTKRSGFVN